MIHSIKDLDAYIEEIQEHIISLNEKGGKSISRCRPSILSENTLDKNEVYYWALEDLRLLICGQLPLPKGRGLPVSDDRASAHID